MRFAKQKALIGLLFLFLPVVTTLAFVQTPFVSNLALQVALKIVRFRTGLRIEASSWSVAPFSFSAALEDISVGVDKVTLRAPALSVQLSPLALVLGRLHLREVRIESPFVYGQLNKRWFDGDASSPSIFRAGFDIPSWAGDQAAQVMEAIERRRLSFDRLKIVGLRSQLRELRLARGDLEASNLSGGQLRAEWAFDDLRVEGRLEPVRRFEGAITLLREKRKQFFLTVRKLRLQLGEESAYVADLSASGRWPGDFESQLVVEGPGLLRWLRHSPWVAGELPKLDLAGRIDLRANGTTRKNKLESVAGTLAARGLKIDGYHLNDVDLEFRRTPAYAEIANLKIALADGVGDRPGPPGTLSAARIRIENDNVKGRLELRSAGLCGILRAADVADCQVGARFTGPVTFEGPLDPLRVRVTTDLAFTDGPVSPDPFTPRNLKDKLVTLKAGKLKGVAVIGPKELQLVGSKLYWGEDSSVQVDGDIAYHPILVNLVAASDAARFESMFEGFLGLNSQGRAKFNARIAYNEEIPRERGRTKVLVNVDVDGWGLEGQTFGQLTGPVEFVRNELHLGPLKIANGGGKALVQGGLRPTPQGSRLRLLGNFDRIEVTAKSPSTGNPLFHGFLSGNANIEGYTDFERHPDGYLAGPLHLEFDTLTAFGIPYQSAVANAVYEGKVLDIRDFRARKGLGHVDMRGQLHPDKGTELRFWSDEVAVKALGWDPRLESIFQEGTLRVDDAFWAPARGWKVHGQLAKLKVAGRRLEPGTIELTGDGARFKATGALGGQMTFGMESDTTGRESRPLHYSANLSDEGLYAAFAWLKRWNAENPVTARGSLGFDWTPSRGEVSFKDLEIWGPQGSDSRGMLLLKAEGARALAWREGRLVRNDFAFGGPSQFAFRGAAGDREVAFQGKLPMALIDLFMPTFKFREGTADITGRMPLPPDISTLTASIRARDAAFSVPGIGQPLTKTQADLELATDGRLSLTSVQGALGSGEVRASGVYRIDSLKPGLFLDVNLNRAQAIILDDIVMDATGDVSLKGEQPPYLMSGKVLVTNALYSKEFNEKPAPAVTESTEPALRFNLDVEISNSRVRNSLASGTVSGKLLVGGTELKPDIQGTLDVLSGSVFAKDNEFRVSQARVAFPGGTAKLPTVNLLATTTVKQPTQDYRVQLQARGSVDQLALDFTSDPALPQGDIVNLLAFGVTRPTNDVASTQKAAQAEALQLVFQNALGSNIKKTTGLDVRLEAASSLQSSAVGEEKTVPKVTVVRKISDKVTATVGRRLEVNQPENSMQVDYNLLRRTKMNVNLTGVWENPTPERRSAGADLRFKFDIE